MNLINAFVTEILSEPYYEYNKWWVKVKYNAYGGISRTELMFSTYEKAKSIKVGFEFNT